MSERCETPRAPKARSLAALVVALVGVAAYAASLGYDFVWDDTLLIQQSVRLHQWGELPRLLLSQFWSEVGEASHYYRPLITLSFFLDVKVWGLRPFGFHLTNLLAHVAVILAVLAVARRVTGGEVAAVIATLTFALQPLHTESVSFVSGRTDVLAALFFLLALLAYDRGRERPGWGFVSGSLGAYLLALLSKEVAITLPAVLALWDWRVRDDLRDRRAVWRAAARYGFMERPDIPALLHAAHGRGCGIDLSDVGHETVVHADDERALPRCGGSVRGNATQFSPFDRLFQAAG